MKEIEVKIYATHTDRLKTKVKASSPDEACVKVRAAMEVATELVDAPDVTALIIDGEEVPVEFDDSEGDGFDVGVEVK